MQRLLLASVLTAFPVLMVLARPDEVPAEAKGDPKGPEEVSLVQLAKAEIRALGEQQATLYVYGGKATGGGPGKAWVDDAWLADAPGGFAFPLAKILRPDLGAGYLRVAARRDDAVARLRQLDPRLRFGHAVPLRVTHPQGPKAARAALEKALADPKNLPDGMLGAEFDAYDPLAFTGLPDRPGPALNDVVSVAVFDRPNREAECIRRIKDAGATAALLVYRLTVTPFGNTKIPGDAAQRLDKAIRALGFEGLVGAEVTRDKRWVIRARFGTIGIGGLGHAAATAGIPIEYESVAFVK